MSESESKATDEAKMTNEYSLKNLINMTNGIIGVSILTMPYCIAQSGLLLGSLALMACGLMTSYSCKLLIESSNLKRCKTFEYLAFKLFGHKGKVLIEICIILLLSGSLITYQQIINDSGPGFTAKLLNFKSLKIPHYLFMVIFTVAITLPLNLSKKLDKVSKISACAVLFYFLLGFYLFWIAFKRFMGGHLFENLNLWNFTGMIKCFPIFSISFSCQTVLFVIYDELNEHSKQNITKLADTGMVLAFIAYIFTGVFGYLAFHDLSIQGNIIANLPYSFMSELTIFGLFVSVVASFPYMIFPCRISINTLLFSSHGNTDDFEFFMPERRFKVITCTLVIGTAVIAILVPNIEFVLSLTGATTGSLICYVWPSILYIYSRPIQNEYKDVLVKAFFYTGVSIFFVCSLTTFAQFQPTKQDTVEVPEVISSSFDVTSKIVENLIKRGGDYVDARQDDLIRLEPPNPNEIQTEHHLKIARNAVDNLKLFNDSINL